MRRPSFLALVLCAALLGANLTLAGTDVPDRFAPWSLDRGLVATENPVDGRTFAAWSYRASDQYDIAISVREAGSGRWSEPVFVGAGDRIQQIQPSLASDAAGNVYLAFLARESGHIYLSTLSFGSGSWSAPVVVTPAPGRRSAPLLRFVAGHLVVAFRTLTGVDLVELPVIDAGLVTQGVQDGPDTLPHEKPPPPDGGEGAPLGRSR